MVELTTNESLVVCDVEYFSPASCITIITHLEENTIFAVESNLPNVVFFFPQDDINLADVILLFEIEKSAAWTISTNFTSLTVV